MKRIILVIAVALVALVGILAVAPGFVDWGKYKEQIVAELNKATGLEFTIGGDLEMALLPFPHVVIGDLTVRNGYKHYPKLTLLKLERADVSVALVPLFSGRVDVSSVELVRPDIQIGVSRDGVPTWMTPEIEAKMKGGGEGTPDSLANAIALNEIAIKEGSLLYRDGRGGRDQKLSDINMALRGDTLLGPYDLKGSFGYAGEKIEAALKSGRIESGAGSVVVQGDIAVPSSSTKIQFSGVTSVKAPLEVQGETGIETANFGSLLKLANGGKKAPAALSKPFSARGVLTLAGTDLSYKNLKMSWDGMEAAGGVSLKLPAENYQKIVADITLDASGPVDAAKLLPPPAKVKKPGFIPDTLTLPVDIGGTVAFSAPSLKHGRVALTNFKFSGKRDEKGTGGAVAGTLPDGGSLDTSFTLAFGSQSRSEKTGVLTLSDPVLSYNAALKAADAAKGVLPLLPEKAAGGAAPYLKGPMTFSGEGEVKPAAVSLSKGTLGLQDAALALRGSFSKGKARDLLTMAAAAEKIDLDKWLPAPKQVATDGKEAAVRGMVEKLALPFDLDLTLALKNARVKGTDYDTLDLLALLSGKKLELKTFELKDSTGNNLVVAGTAGDIGALKDLDLSIHGVTPDAKKLLAGFGRDAETLPKSLKAAELVSEFKGQADKLAFTANIKAMGGTFDATGQLADVLDKPAVSGLTLRVRHPNYVEIIRLSDPSFTGGVAMNKNLDLFASMKREGDIYSFGDLKAVIGPAEITGEVKADMTGAKPAVTASIQAGDLPLDLILGHDARHKGTVRSQPQRQGQNQDIRWSRDPLNLDWMHKFNLDLDASVKTLSYGPWNFTNAVASVSLKDGAMTVKDVSGGMHGGKGAVSGKAVSAAPGQPVAIDGKVALENVSLESFVSSFSGSRLVRAKGAVSLDADVATTGASAAALIFDLKGQGKASGSDLVFEGFDLARLSRALAQPTSSMTENLTGLLDASMSGGATAFDTLSSAFTISQGVVNISELILTGKDATVNAPGLVNLPLWTIDMEASIKLAEPADAPPLKVAIKGPLDNPGQAFGKSAMESYVGKFVGDRVQDAIGGFLEDQGLIPKAAPAPAPAQQQVIPLQEPASGAEAAPVPAQPAPVKRKAPREPEPEEIFMDVLQGVLQGQ